jgi:thymidylate synthase (FAD)
MNSVKLLHASPLWLASNAIIMSHNNHHLSDTKTIETEFGTVKKFIGEKDKALIAKVGNKLKHKSVLEQLVYWFDIDGISRACLQELARHRTARLTVKSTRYTLKELKYETSFYDEEDGYFISDDDYKKASKYLVFNSSEQINRCSVLALEELRMCISNGISNNMAKYCLPEAFKTRLQWQIDGRNLQNFLELRSSKDALWEIKALSNTIYEQLPKDHLYLYEDFKENK